MLALRLAILVVLATVAAGQPAAPPPGWIGVGVEDAGDIARDDDAPGGLGLKINQVWGESPGWIGGLRTGDVLVRFDGAPLTGERAALPARFKELVGAHRAGETVRLVVRRRESRVDVAAGAAVRPAAAKGEPDPPVDDPRRWLEAQPPGTTLEIKAARVERRVECAIVLGIRPNERPPETPGADPKAFAGYPLGPVGAPSALARLSGLLVGVAGARAARAELERGLAAMEASDDGFRLDVVRALHADPFRLEAGTARLGADLLGSAAPGQAAIATGFRVLGIPEPAADAADAAHAADDGPLTPDELLARIEHSLGRAAAEVELAFAAWTPEERAAAPARLDALFECLGESIYLFEDVETRPVRRRATLELLAMARRTDVAHFERAAAAMAWIVDRDRLARTLARVRWASSDERAKPIVRQRDTAWGPIVLAGTGNDVHRELDAAVLIDLGGDDVYANNAGASVPGKIPVAVLVDLGGDDAYESHRRYAQGTGALGLGILVDWSGDDSYIATQAAQGCGVFGLGVLVDLAGRDRYRGLTVHQGVGLVGVGALVDGAGDDRYEAQLYAQGVGLPRGAGLLVDIAGDDEYYAKGQRPTGYGTAGVFDAWSQGCGLGFRLDASGGVGVLADGAGRDRYEAGNFAQGGGYYYGWGALIDHGADDDRYVASRYGQGWAAHQALGSFIESGGDDRYATRHGVICGLAWDQSAALFLDRAGDDRYDTGFFSLGASAHNSVCLFADLGGRDVYRGAPPARIGGNDYHGGTSWALFVDAGGGRDAYERGDATAPDFGDDRVLAGPDHWGFADLPGRIEDALLVAEPVERAAPPAK